MPIAARHDTHRSLVRALLSQAAMPFTHMRRPRQPVTPHWTAPGNRPRGGGAAISLLRAGGWMGPVLSLGLIDAVEPAAKL